MDEKYVPEENRNFKAPQTGAEIMQKTAERETLEQELELFKQQVHDHTKFGTTSFERGNYFKTAEQGLSDEETRIEQARKELIIAENILAEKRKILESSKSIPNKTTS